MASVQAAAATDGERASSGGERPSDPSYMWVVESEKYLLSLRLPGLKLEDFLVRVDGKRRLTITDRDRRKPTPGKAPRLNKTTFQLPKTANPDAITGRFDGDVLTLTVPTKSGKQRPAGTAAAKKEEEEEEEEEEPPKAKAKREHELIDTAVAAFTLGVFFSRRIFPGRNE